MSTLPHCNKNFYFWRNVFIVINVIVLLSTIIITFKFIQSHLAITDKEKWAKKKTIFYVSLLFICFTILSLSGLLIEISLSCIHHIFLDYSFLIFITLYLLQSGCLLLISFIRVKYVFDTTFMKLSKCTIRFYYIIFVILALFIPLSMIELIDTENDILYIITAFAASMVFLLLIFLSVSIMILFIRKLIQVYKMVTKDDDLIEIITRSTILTLVSISVTLIVLPTSGIQMQYPWILVYVFLFDITTNFLCIMLSFDLMKEYYVTICGCIDSQCKKCWTNIVQNEADSNRNQTAVSV